MTVRIPIIDDDIAEPTECFEVSLVAGAAAGPKVLIGDVGNACVQILDDDGKYFPSCKHFIFYMVRSMRSRFVIVTLPSVA